MDKVIYYSDELNDEFAGDNIVPIKIDKNYIVGSAEEATQESK